MNKEQLSALNDIAQDSIDTLHDLVEEIQNVGETELDKLQRVAERISEEAFNLVELLAAAQEEDYD